MLCRWHFGDESSSLAYSVLLIGADTQATNTGNMGIINRQNRKAKEQYRKAWEQAVYAFKAHPSAGPSSLIAGIHGRAVASKKSRTGNSLLNLISVPAYMPWCQFGAERRR